MKISVRTAVLLIAISANIVTAQTQPPTAQITRAQSPPSLAYQALPEMTLTPQYPAPAPAGGVADQMFGANGLGAQGWPTGGLPVGGDPGYPTVQGGAQYGGIPQGDVFPGAAAGSLGGGAFPTTSAYPPITQPMPQSFPPPITALRQQQFGQDPFLAPNQISPNQFSTGGGGLAQQLGDQSIMMMGANGPAPYRFGWQQHLKLHWLSDSDVENGPVAGDFGQFGLDYDWQWTQQMPDWIFVSRPHYALRSWDTASGLGLPDRAHTLGYEFRMEVPRGVRPHTFLLSVTPSINTDFDGTTTSDAWNIDSRGAFIFQTNRYWQVVLGYQYWDRLNDRLLPYGGLVYTDDFWEWRLTFPEARVSLFLGNEYLWSKWLYARLEYHVEAYEVSNRIGGREIREQVELEDWRALVGLRMNTGRFDWFLEGGWVFEREVEFKRSPGFEVDSGFIGQIGFRF